MSRNEDRSMLGKRSDENDVSIRHPNQIQLQFSNSYVGGIVIDNQNIQGQGDTMTSDVKLDEVEGKKEEEVERMEEDEGDDGSCIQGNLDGVVVRCRDIEIIHHEEDVSGRDSGSERGLSSSMPNQHSHLHHHNRHQHSVYSRKSHHSNSFLLPRCSITGDICPLSICPMNSTDCSSSLSPIRRSSIRRSSIRASSPPGGRVSMRMQVSPKESVSGMGQECVSGMGQECVSGKRGSIQDQEDCDRVDSLPKDMSFTWIDIIAILFSICSFLFDITTDTIVAAFHLKNGDKWYFTLTTVFIVVPTLVMTGISLRWYVLDAREEGSPKISPWKWFTRTLFLLLQLGPILRYVDSLIYGLKFRRHKANKLEQKKYYQYMVYEDTDATMLRLFECFMEAAPQLVLQLYILARKTASNDPTLLVMTQVTAVFASLVSLGWSLVSYHRALRMSLQDKINMTWQGMAFQFLWRICVIGARVVALAMFAARYKEYIALVCGVHWFLMFVWIISMRTTFCDNRCEELGYNAVLGVMFIFCYFNPVDSPTRYRYSFFYSFMFLENTLLMTLFFIHPDSIHSWYRLPAMIGHFLAFFLGIAFMITYYLVFHPTKAIKIFRSKEDDGENEVERKLEARKGGYKRQTSCNLWMNQGRVLHPRPAVPAITSTHSCSEINMLEHIISPGMHSDTKHSDTKHSDTKHSDTKHSDTKHSDTKHSPKNGSGHKKKEEDGRKKEENGRKKRTLFASLIKPSASSASGTESKSANRTESRSADRTESKSANESHEKYKARDPDELISPQSNRSGNDCKNILSNDGPHLKNVPSSDGHYKNVSSSANGRSLATFVTESSGEPC